MAAIQQTPITCQSRSPHSIRSRIIRPVNLSFSGSIASVKLPKIKLNRNIKMADSAAGSYASALAEVATANGTLEATVNDLEKLEKLFSETDVYNFFLNPIIEPEKKQEIITEIAASSDLQPHVTNFINILLDMNRLNLFIDIVKEFELAYNKLTGTELAIVTSVVPLDSQHLAQIAKGVQKLTGSKNVRIKTAIDPALVAGFTIRYGQSGSRLIDMSVKKQLEEISEKLEIEDDRRRRRSPEKVITAGEDNRRQVDQ